MDKAGYSSEPQLPCWTGEQQCPEKLDRKADFQRDRDISHLSAFNSFSTGILP